MTHLGQGDKRKTVGGGEKDMFRKAFFFFSFLFALIKLPRMAVCHFLVLEIPR